MESARHQMPQMAPPADANHGVSAEPASASGVARERPAASCSGSSPTAPALGPAGLLAISALFIEPLQAHFPWLTEAKLAFSNFVICACLFVGFSLLFPDREAGDTAQE